MEETLNTTETIEMTADVAVNEEAQAPQTPQEQLSALVNRRMGEFDVRINYTDLKYVKNSINSKVEWKGPNEAYLVIMSILTIDNVLEALDPKKMEPTIIKMPASTIESINFFLNKTSGKGIEPAQKLFSISMMFRQSMETLKKLDQEIELLQAEIKETEKTAN
jgi:hypothetical protein